MKRDWLALRPLVATVATLAVTLAVLLGLAALARAGAVVSPPEEVAEQALRGVAGGNYEQAVDKLSPAAQESVDAGQLKEIAERIAATHGGIEDVNGETARTSGHTAVAVVMVKLGDGSEHELELPMVEDDHTWQVDSIEPLRELAAG